MIKIITTGAKSVLPFSPAIKAGDFVLVPPNSTHHFKNTGDEVLTRITFNPKESEEFLWAQTY